MTRATQTPPQARKARYTAGLPITMRTGKRRGSVRDRSRGSGSWSLLIAVSGDFRSGGSCQRLRQHATSVRQPDRHTMGPGCRADVADDGGVDGVRVPNLFLDPPGPVRGRGALTDDALDALVVRAVGVSLRWSRLFELDQRGIRCPVEEGVRVALRGCGRSPRRGVERRAVSRSCSRMVLLASATVLFGSSACSAGVQQVATPQQESLPVLASALLLVVGLAARTMAACMPSATAWAG